MADSRLKTIVIHTMIILGLSLGLSVPVLAADFATTKLKAEQEHADAQYRLALMYDYGEEVEQDYAQAFKWYHRSANQGYEKAQYNLGWMYKNAHGMPEDNAKAVEWYLKAANQGYAPAQATVGSMYYSGKGVTQSYAKALE